MAENSTDDGTPTQNDSLVDDQKDTLSEGGSLDSQTNVLDKDIGASVIPQVAETEDEGTKNRESDVRTHPEESDGKENSDMDTSQIQDSSEDGKTVENDGIQKVNTNQMEEIHEDFVEKNSNAELDSSELKNVSLSNKELVSEDRNEDGHETVSAIVLALQDHENTLNNVENMEENGERLEEEVPRS